MGVGHDGGLTVNVTQHQIGRLASDARQAQQVFHVVGHPAAELGQQHLRRRLEVARLGVEQAAGLDAVLDGFDRGVREALEGGEAGEEVGRHQIDPRVRALGGQTGGE